MFKNSGSNYSVIYKKILQITKHTVFNQTNVIIWEARIIYGKDVSVNDENFLKSIFTIFVRLESRVNKIGSNEKWVRSLYI
jgi:hypothetical protein